MATQLLIKRGSTAISERDVRIDKAIEARTDANGFVHVDLEPGSHRLYIRVEGDTLKVPFRLESEGDLHVLDIDESLADAMRETAGLPDDIPLEVAGRYRVQDLLGRGGMGIVVRAWDTLLERRVAIKFLNKEMATHDEAQDIFLKEARSLARLRHDSLVDVHDVSIDDGQPVMVTEFVEGNNLATILAERGALKAQQVLTLAQSVCEGLAHMHQHDLIHRDVKPANIILQPDGHLKLIDFGLARSLEHLMSQGTQIRGTPAYMAPEQVRGEKLGPATDVYQLGVTLFELATGTIPFPDDPHGLAHVEQPVPSLESRGVDPDPRLERFIDACLQKAPENRPGNASVILSYLKSETDSVAAEAASTTSDPRPALPPWAITATSTVGVVALAAVAWLYLGPKGDESQPTDDLRDAAPPVSSQPPSSTRNAAVERAISGAGTRITGAVGVAEKRAEGVSPAPDKRLDAPKKPPPSGQSGASAKKPPDEPARGSAEPARGSRSAQEENPAPADSSNLFDPSSPDAGIEGLEASPEKPEASEPSKEEAAKAEADSNSSDAGNAAPSDVSPSTDEPSSDDEPTDEPSKEEPPKPRFF